MMSQHLQPGSFDTKDANSATAKWEEKFRIYSKRCWMLLPDDIMRSILAEMTEGPLKEQHVPNTAILRDNDGAREEIECYLENRQNSSQWPWMSMPS